MKRKLCFYGTKPLARWSIPKPSEKHKNRNFVWDLPWLKELCEKNQCDIE